MPTLSQLAAEFIAVYVPVKDHEAAMDALAYLLNTAKLQGMNEQKPAA